MKRYTLDSKEEKENKRRGLIIAFFVHLILIGLACSPMMRAIENINLVENAVELASFQSVELEKPPKEFVVNADDKARKNKSSKESKSTKEELKPIPNPALEPQPTPKPTEVLEEEETQPVATSEQPMATTTSTTEAQEADDSAPTTAPAQGSTTPSNTNQAGGTANNNSSTSGDGGDDDSLQEGVFGRKVMKRPNIKGLTKKNGRIAIKVCVSQEGTVIATKFLQKQSTIYDAQLVAAAAKAARRYKFDVDYTAPKKQWGKLTFTFHIG